MSNNQTKKINKLKSNLSLHTLHTNKISELEMDNINNNNMTNNGVVSFIPKNSEESLYNNKKIGIESLSSLMTNNFLENKSSSDIDLINTNINNLNYNNSNIKNKPSTTIKLIQIDKNLDLKQLRYKKQKTVKSGKSKFFIMESERLGLSNQGIENDDDKGINLVDDSETITLKKTIQIPKQTKR